jgi:hypothetical protein
MVDLVGVKADGTQDVLGKVAMPPAMKAREIVRNYFGEPVVDGDEADLCLAALQDFEAWLLEQGWTKPELKVALSPV